NPALRALREGLIVGLANHTILISKTGQERSIDDSGAPIRNGDGNVIGSILVFRDISEQKRGDERLRESERQLADFFENATIGLHWVGPDGIIIRVNKTELEMLGYEREEYVGRSITEFHADQEVICEILQRLGAGENLREYPARLKCKNGSIKEVLIDSSVMWKDGEFVHTRCFTRDVTERNRAEVARAEAERRLNAVFNQQFQFMVILAADGTVIDANEMCFTATGYMRTDIIGQVFWKTPWWNGLPDMPMKWQVFVADALRGAAPRTAEMQYARSDGTIRLATTIVSGLKNDEGKVVNVIIEGRDDTARKRQEAELRESEEKLRLLADTIPQLAWMAQPDGYISWYNRRWYEYTGKSREEMEGWGWQSVHDPEVLPTVLERWRESLATGEPFDMIYPLRDRDGELRPFLTRVNPLRDPNGRIIYWFGTSTDISDIKRMEEALRDADRRKDKFLATLAHELRNPLAPIRNSLQILKMPRVDPEMVLQTRDIMERQVHHLVRLVDDLLDVSRVMRGKIELRREPIELATVIARAVETANPLIEVQGHELEISVPKESLLVNVDPVRLAQVIGNLLTNSAKYMDSNGHIWLSASKEGEHAVLTVRDTGIGISLELLPHVFELFVQADHTSTKAQGGLGIGLTLVKNLVQMHGGSVRAESAGVGKGSEFTIVLPLIHGEMSAASEEGSASHSTEPTASGLRIIVVDDNRDAAVSLSMLLRLQGHDVRVNHDGQSALDVAANYLPDVVFLDLGMPKMDGFGVAERIRTLTGLKNVVLVALTGWGQQQDRKRTAEAGFNYHLVKPPEPTEIESLLGDLVRSGSQRQS
ncbi:MAG: domain S-box-containing protein, partial [Planctomycetaceae bacterium]|nr:domain S-box-containing protein [Planctomycetaceae bacterium]